MAQANHTVEEKAQLLLAPGRSRKQYSSHVPTEELVDMKATVPQRIDSHGSKVEDTAGTGEYDAPGG
ncbi:MAG: hypothetical protein HY235_15025 [Acidobacteria bacterium]|nr:hypothetical protein [Acidobacteriota bacterium]